MPFWKKTHQLNDQKLGRYWGSLSPTMLVAITDSGRATAGDMAWDTSLLCHVGFNGTTWEPAGTQGGITAVAAATITQGDIVAITGYDTTYGVPTVTPADATTSASEFEDLYFAPAAVANAALGTFTKRWTGVITQNITGYSDADELYLSSTAGEVINAAYDTSTETNIRVGQVLDASAYIAHIDLSGDSLVTHDHGSNSEGGTALTPVTVTATGLVSGATVGYATGAGGTVTQATNRTTGVTLNNICGTITTNNASLAAEGTAEFVVTNSTVALGDVVILSEVSGSNGGGTVLAVTGVAAGSFNISVHNGNVAAGTAETGAIIINFAVIKAVSA